VVTYSLTTLLYLFVLYLEMFIIIQAMRCQMVVHLVNKKLNLIREKAVVA